jgi:hypothetical protein
MDANLLPNTYNPPEIAQYILQKVYGGNKRLGIRRDNWASTDEYVTNWMENNNRGSFNGLTFGQHIMARWQLAPINGEPYNYGDGTQDNNEYATLESEVQFYKVSSFGNGNFVWSPSWSANSPNKSYVRAASKRAGHRLNLNSGSLTSSIVRGTPFSLSLTWGNDGVCPTYENWDVMIELRSGSTVVWSAKSSAVLRLFLPGTMTVNDGFTIPIGVAADTYNMHLIIRNSEWPARLMPLHITGVQGDGSYILKSNVVVS